MLHVPAGSARIGPIHMLPALLAELGVDAARLLAAACVDPHVFDDPDNVMAYRDLGRLLVACASATGIPHFGLLLGQRVQPATLGVVAQLALHAPDVGTALRGFETYLHIFDRGCTLSVGAEDGSVCCACAIDERETLGTDQIYDLVVCVLVGVVAALCGQCWRPERVLLPHRAPADPRPFRRIFRAPVAFDAEQAACIFAERCLRRPIALSDPALYRSWLREVAAIDARTDRPVQERVRWLLRDHLPRQWLDETDVARLLRVDASTLRRRLRREGSGFRRLSAEVRFEAARHFLAHSDIALHRLAVMLGYCEHSAFTRAFRSWAGMPPAAWRARQRYGR